MNMAEELPSYFHDNPWLGILTRRGVEPEEPLARPALSTAPEVAQASPSPVRASSAPQAQGQEIAQLINALMGMMVRSSQAQVAHAQAQASAQPMVMVVPIIIQMPVPCPVTAQCYGIGGCGGVLCTPRNGENAELVFQGTPSPPPRPAAPGIGDGTSL